MKKIALLMIIIFYSGCSRLDLVLNYAPRYITNEIDDALDLNSERFKNIKTVVTHDIDVNKKAIISEIIVKIEYLLMLTNNMELKYSEVQFSFNEFKDMTLSPKSGSWVGFSWGWRRSVRLRTRRAVCSRGPSAAALDCRSLRGSGQCPALHGRASDKPGHSPPRPSAFS